MSQQDLGNSLDSIIEDLTSKKEALERKKEAIEASLERICDSLARLQMARTGIDEVSAEVLQLLGGGNLVSRSEPGVASAQVCDDRPAKKPRNNFELARNFILAQGNTPQTTDEVLDGTGLPRDNWWSVYKRHKDDFVEHLKEGRQAWTVRDTAPPDSSAEQESATQENVDDSSVKLRPARAILGLLRLIPRGVRLSDLVNRLDGKLLSSSRDQKSVLYSTVAYLKKTGKIVENPDGELVLTKEGSEK